MLKPEGLLEVGRCVRPLNDVPNHLVVIEAGGIRLLDKRRLVGSNPTYHYFLPGKRTANSLNDAQGG
jgi:hypothetical protein